MQKHMTRHSLSDKEAKHPPHLESAGGLQQRRCGTVFFCDTITGVAVRRLIVAEAASNHPALFKVCGAALARVAAHAVFSTT